MNRRQLLGLAAAAPIAAAIPATPARALRGYDATGRALYHSGGFHGGVNNSRLFGETPSEYVFTEPLTVECRFDATAVRAEIQQHFDEIKIRFEQDRLELFEHGAGI